MKEYVIIQLVAQVLINAMFAFVLLLKELWK